MKKNIYVSVSTDPVGGYQEILDYAREELEQLSFRAVVHKENTSSRRLCEKLGFTNTGQTMQKEEDEYLEYCINKI